MTRDVSGRRLFSINDVFALAAGAVSIAAIIGAVGGYLVLQYRVGQAEIVQEKTAAALAENDRRDAQRDILIARTVERLDGVAKALAEVKHGPATAP